MNQYATDSTREVWTETASEALELSSTDLRVRELRYLFVECSLLLLLLSRHLERQTYQAGPARGETIVTMEACLLQMMICAS